MNHRIQVIVDGTAIVDASDGDETMIVNALRIMAESIERFGLGNSLRALEKSSALREAVFAEAKCGGAFVSTFME